MQDFLEELGITYILERAASEAECDSPNTGDPAAALATLDAADAVLAHTAAGNFRGAARAAMEFGEAMEAMGVEPFDLEECPWDEPAVGNPGANVLRVVSIEQWRRERDAREAQAGGNSANRYLGTMDGQRHLKLEKRVQRRNARLRRQGFGHGNGPGVA